MALGCLSKKPGRRRLSRARLHLLACAIASAAIAGCGARSGVEDGSAPADAAPADRVEVDASVPERALGVWRFHTVRALCDTFAVAFCDDGQVFVRLSFDDFCDGANPVGERPARATSRWTAPHEVTLDFEAGGGRYSAMLRLVEAAEPDADRFELVSWDGDLRGFPWDDGRRAETMEPPLPPGFVSCM